MCRMSTVTTALFSKGMKNMFYVIKMHMNDFQNMFYNLVQIFEVSAVSLETKLLV